MGGDQAVKRLIQVPVGLKRTLIFAHDIAWLPVCVVVSYWLRENLGFIHGSDWKSIGLLTLVSAAVYGPSFWVFGCYRGIWRYASIPDLIRLIKAVVVAAPLTILICFLIGRLEGIPRSVLLLYPFLLIIVLISSRVFYRIFRDHRFRLDFGNRQSALLIGAGRAGEMLLRDLEHSESFDPVGFLDDDPAKIGHEVRGIRVYGTTDELIAVVRKLEAQVVLVTMPSAPPSTLNKIVSQCAQAGVKCITLPSMRDLADGRIEVSRLRAVTVEDLLGRDPVELDPQTVESFLRGKRILVTGGGGSIGSELCRQIGKHKPRLLTILDNCEYNLYRIDQEINTTCPGLLFNSLLSDVRDPGAIRDIFEQHKPQVVFHAAAYKHVPLVEDNIIEGVRNNVFGTRVVADMAKRYGVETFVLISTDKTVNPTNVMGTTKRVAELYCQVVNESSSTHFITTRFGNVLGSAGSVVPLFKRQIEAGGPITVTHPEITRFFMTIPEAANLILQAGSIGRGGEIFVLDMGEPVRIRSLAEKLIQLSGLQPGRDIQIVYTGLRPGEKLHEELFYAQETLRTTVHPKLMLTSGTTTEAALISDGLVKLKEAIDEHDQEQALSVLRTLVPEFNHSVSLEERKQRQMHPHLKIVK